MLLVLDFDYKMESLMPDPLDRLRDTLNKLFDVLEVLFVRIVLLALAGMEAYALIVGHH